MLGVLRELLQLDRRGVGAPAVEAACLVNISNVLAVNIYLELGTFNVKMLQGKNRWKISVLEGNTVFFIN